jgi:hypothetical protein
MVASPDQSPPRKGGSAHRMVSLQPRFNAVNVMLPNGYAMFSIAGPHLATQKDDRNRPVTIVACSVLVTPKKFPFRLTALPNDGFPDTNSGKKRIGRPACSL